MPGSNIAIQVLDVKRHISVFPTAQLRAQFVAERRCTRNVTLAHLLMKCQQCGNNLN